MTACANVDAEVIVPVGLVGFILGMVVMLCLISASGGWRPK